MNVQGIKIIARCSVSGCSRQATTYVVNILTRNANGDPVPDPHDRSFTLLCGPHFKEFSDQVRDAAFVRTGFNEA